MPPREQCARASHCFLRVRQVLLLLALPCASAFVPALHSPRAQAFRQARIAVAGSILSRTERAAWSTVTRAQPLPEPGWEGMGGVVDDAVAAAESTSVPRKLKEELFAALEGMDRGFPPPPFPLTTLFHSCSCACHSCLSLWLTTFLRSQMIAP